MILSASSAIQPFLDYLKYQKRYSLHTIISYQGDLTDFFDFISIKYGEVALSHINSSILRTWLASLKQNGMSSKTINRKISTLKSFFKYHLKKEIISSNPAATLISLKTNKRLPSFVEQKNMSLLFSHIDFPDNWKGKTDRLILKIFYETGMRLSELINLKESQIDTDKANIKVLGKGNKERIIPVQQELIKEIIIYLNEKRNFQFAEPFVLLNEKGNQLYAKYVYNTVKNYLNKITTNERKSPHTLRHSFATHLTNNGADINAVKSLLGHSSLAATQVYTHNTIERLKDIHKKAHPKS